jgi:hypothetical protein
VLFEYVGNQRRFQANPQSFVHGELVGENLAPNEILRLLLPLETQLGRKIDQNCYTQSEYARRLNEPDSFINRILAHPPCP